MHKRLYVSFQIVAFMALALFLVGCTSNSAPSSSPLGTWVTTLSEAEAPVFYGQYEVTFAENGRYAVRHSRSGGAALEGRYTLAQDQIVMTDELGPCVASGAQSATYKWSVEKDVLTLTLLNDPCYTRRVATIGRTWSRGKLAEPLVPTAAPMLK